MAAADPLQTSFNRADAAIALAEQRLEGSFASTFAGADAKLNPARMLKRLARLEQEIPALRKAAEANAAARRQVLGDLHGTLAANHQGVVGVAARAAADVGAEEDAWRAAASDAEATAAGRQPAHAAAGGGSAADNTGAAAAAAAGPPASSSVAIGELAWLRLGAAAREGVTLEELNEFWRLLRGLFVRRETRELQAAQLLALGVRMTDENARRLKLLERLGVIRVGNNAIGLAE